MALSGEGVLLVRSRGAETWEEEPRGGRVGNEDLARGRETGRTKKISVCHKLPGVMPGM